MRNPCKECDYYHSENNTCQSKKCCTGGSGYITWIDRLFCKPYKYKADRKTENSSEKPNNCDTCKYGEDKHRYAHICNECGVGINNYEPKDKRQEERSE